MKSWVFLLLVFVVRGGFCAKILGIFPFPFKSHFACTNAVMSSLSKAGHDVTMITPYPREAASKNYTRIIDMSMDSAFVLNTFRYDEHRKMSASTLFRLLTELEIPTCNLVFRKKEYQDLLNSRDTKFDVIFVEIHSFHNCFLPIAKKLNVPVIGVTTYKSWYFSERAIDNVIHPADVPQEYITTWEFDTLYGRLINTWNYLSSEYALHMYVRPGLKRFFSENEEQLKPYEGFLDIKPSLIFLNSHHSVLPRSLNPNVIEIAGLQVAPAKPLPENILKFIEEAQHGVILFSFGSVVNASSLPSHMVECFVNVFASIPQRVIWKYEEEMQNVPQNVLLLKWLPQRDILEHPNVNAFISHCGQNGVYEAIYTATPVIAYPLRIDQPGNAAILVNLGVAVELDIDSVSEDSLLKAINSVINDTKYYDNMQKLSKQFKDRPMTPEQSVVYWTEYVIRHNGASNLRPPSTRLNFYQYCMLDVVSVVVVISTCVILSVYWCLRMVLNKLKITGSKCSITHKNKFD